MRKIIDLSAKEAGKYFLKGECYFRDDFPKYISFESLINSVSDIMQEKHYKEFISNDKAKHPKDISGVNYSFTANKDGRFAWRPYELMHPVIYVSLVNDITRAFCI